MGYAHRENDERACGGKTIVTGQDWVRIDGNLWAVEADEDSHGDGQLVSTEIDWIHIDGKKIIIIGDTASGDNHLHQPDTTKPGTASDWVRANG